MKSNFIQAEGEEEQEQEMSESDQKSMTEEQTEKAADSEGENIDDSSVSEGEEEVHTDAPPSDAVSEYQNLFKPLPGVAPEQIPEPSSMGESTEPAEELSWEEGEEEAQEQAAEVFEEMGGDGIVSPDWDAALAQAMVFSGDDAPDILNLQMWDAGDPVSVPEMKEVNSDNAAGNWIMNNMILAGTTGKMIDIANLTCGDQSYMALKPTHIAHIFGYIAITFEFFVNILELITGILNVISLVLTAVMTLAIILMGMFYGLGTLFAAMPWTAPAAPAMFATANFFQGIWTPIASWLVTLSNIIAYFTAIRAVLRVITILLWLLDALTAGAVLGWEHASEGLARATKNTVGSCRRFSRIGCF